MAFGIKALPKGRAATIVVAGNNSSARVKRNADYVCDGVDDQWLINAAISSISQGSVFFAPDAIFNLSGQVNLKSKIDIVSNGSIFKSINQVSSNLAIDAVAGQKIVKPVSVTGFKPSMQVQLNGTSWESITIDSVDPITNTLVMKTNLVNSYVANDTVFSNFSCLVGRDVSLVNISGVEIDWNVANNPQSNDTTFAQNGIEFYTSSMCSVKDSYVHDGGRHGIVTTDAPYITVQNCIANGWLEHGIDIYHSGIGDTNPLSYTSITDCVTNSNGWNGIQCHRGSGVKIKGCTANSNGLYGICAGREYAHDNVVSNCNVEDNGNHQLYAEQGSYNISFIGNISKNGQRCGLQLDTCKNIIISDNQLSNNSWTGMELYTSNQCIVKSNQMYNNNLTDTTGIEIGLTGTSSYNLITGNNIYRDVLSSTSYGISEDSTSNDYNKIMNNQVTNLATTLNIKGVNTISTPNYIY